MRASPDAIILSDQDGTIRMASRVAHTLVGLDEGTRLEGRSLQSFIHPSSIGVLQANIQRLYSGEKLGVNEYRGLRHDGSTFAMETSSELLMSPDKRTIQLISVVRDVSERRQLEQELVQKGQDLLHLNEVLRSSSVTDSLTGLHNRRYFDEAFAKAYEEARQGETTLALLIIDLDRFKLVNDTFGHAVGDSVLVRIAQAMKEKAWPGTLLARWGGEEFVLLAKGMNREQVVQHAQQLRVHLADLAHEQVGRITVSIGVATYQGTENVHQLFKRADDALYQAKQAGRNCVFSV
ncbi:MAG: sensor domain-containing diguanylate cyclase [Spirochaetia bacterium]|nr:sensor domain-containing diguanylate cyclase [Spirochaetia bacterium]NCC89732.1 sensor domain-containing diguanylate cyclase [Spirochaetia bacterium]